MKFGKWLSLVALVGLGGMLVINVSCSEFGNSPKDVKGVNPQNPSNPSDKIGGKNPFPADSGYRKPNEGSFSVEKMLVNVGTNVVQPAVKDFSFEASYFVRELDKACRSSSAARMDSKEWINAQNQWKKAMLAFHYIESMSVGPLAENAFYSHFYAWPFVSLCGIDQAVVNRSESGVEFDGSKNPINVKGLSALEYVLFDTNLTSNCNRRAYPKVLEWSQKPVEEKVADRCALAKDLAKDLERNAKNLEKAWDSEEGNFSKTLVDGSKYKSIKAATNELLHGLYSIEELKDLRLGRPLGLHKECTNDDKKCPEMAEHALSGIALEAMDAQVRGFHDAFFGSVDDVTKAFGFDDYLASAGHPDVATRMGVYLKDLDQSLRKLSKLGKFQDQIAAMNAVDCKNSTISDRRVELCSLFQEVREVTTVLKTEVLGILSLDAPPGYQGDND